MNTKAIINIAKAQLGLDEETYRSLLARVTGKESLRVMSERERMAVVEELKRLGFRITHRGSSMSPSRKPYIRKIFALWKSLHQLESVTDGSRRALRGFCKRVIAHGQKNVVVDPDMLTYAEAAPIIEALKKMEARAKAKAGKR